MDEDDTVTRQAIDGGTLNDAGVRVNWHIGPNTAGLCETQHTLWRNSGGTAEIYMITCDDVCFGTRGWDDVIRDTSKKFPDGIFLAVPVRSRYVRHLHLSDFRRRWLETLQQIFPGHFPYWYDDRWVHQIGEMAGCYVRLPIVMPPIRGKGKTRRMRDLPFWARFFQLCLDERKDSARKLIDAMNLTAEEKNAALKNLNSTPPCLKRSRKNSPNSTPCSRRSASRCTRRRNAARSTRRISRRRPTPSR